MDWSPQLAAGESLRWAGRPAPRCYVFRNWRHSLFGMLLLLLSTWWLSVGQQLGQVYGIRFLAWLPLPFVLIGFYLAIGHLLLARMEWERVFYAVTDGRVLVRRGLWRPRRESLELAAVTYFQLRPYGMQLASIRIRAGADGKSLLLCCVEHPGEVATLLESAMRESGVLATGVSEISSHTQ